MKRINKITLNALLKLTKFWLSVSVAVTTLAGYLIFSENLTLNALLAALGVLFLSAAAAILNQYQERNIDKKMDRTKYRPIPEGVISTFNVFVLFSFFIVIGTVFLICAGSIIGVFLGLFNLIWYNFIYTPLKQKTAFAAIPGAVCGAIPPVIGWFNAGGSLFDQQIIVLALFMFMWQIPHFWLVILKHGRQYESAGFKSLHHIFSDDAIRNLTFIWGLATAIGAILLSLYDLIFNPLSKIILIVFFFAFSISFYIALYRSKKQFILYSLAFASINTFMLLVLILAVIERFL